MLNRRTLLKTSLLTLIPFKNVFGLTDGLNEDERIIVDALMRMKRYRPILMFGMFRKEGHGYRFWVDDESVQNFNIETKSPYVDFANINKAMGYKVGEPGPYIEPNWTELMDVPIKRLYSVSLNGELI